MLTTLPFSDQIFLVCRGGRINVPVLYLHRFLRLTPFLGVAILITVSVLKYAGSGPLWPVIMNMLSGQCEENWWKTMLYVQNYVSPDNVVSHSYDFVVCCMPFGEVSEAAEINGNLRFQIFSALATLGTWPWTHNSSYYRRRLSI